MVSAERLLESIAIARMLDLSEANGCGSTA
jgi:hypothetical protein